MWITWWKENTLNPLSTEISVIIQAQRAGIQPNSLLFRYQSNLMAFTGEMRAIINEGRTSINVQHAKVPAFSISR